MNSLCIIKTNDWRGGVASEGGASRSDELQRMGRTRLYSKQKQ